MSFRAKSARRKPAQAEGSLKSEVTGGILLFSILLAFFADGGIIGNIDRLLIVALLGLGLLVDRTLRIPRPMIIASVLLVAYAAVWSATCSTQFCSAPVANIPVNLFYFVIYLVAFFMIVRRKLVRLTHRSVAAAILGLTLYLIVTSNTSFNNALAALGGANFYTTSRLGSSNQVNNVNYISYILATLVPFVFPRSFKDAIGWFACLNIAFLIVLTFSRAGLLLYTLMFAAGMVSQSRYGFKAVILLVPIAALGYLALGALGYFDLRSFTLTGDGSYAARLDAFYLLGQVELWGEKGVLSEFLNRGGAIDSTLVRYIVGSGLFFLLALLGMLSLLGKPLRSINKAMLARPEMLAMIAWLATLIIDDTFFSSWGAFLIAKAWVTISQAQPLRRTQRRKARAAPYPIPARASLTQR